MAELDFRAYYKIDGQPAIAWRAVRYVTEQVGAWEDSLDEDDTDYEYEPSWERVGRDDKTRVVCIMVGDDCEFTFDVDELTPIEGDVCSCGQIGCGWH